MITLTKSLFLLAFLVVSGLGLNFKLKSNRALCMRFQGGSIYTLEYVISGKDDDKVLCSITEGSKLIMQRQDLSEHEFTYNYQTLQPIKICFLSTDGQEKQVSFDFYHPDDPIRKMIDKKDISLVQAALSEAYIDMQAISRNHLEESEQKIKWAGIIKIIFLLSSALIQLWIMKGFFTSSNPYQPVEQM